MKSRILRLILGFTVLVFYQNCSQISFLAVPQGTAGLASSSPNSQGTGGSTPSTVTPPSQPPVTQVPGSNFVITPLNTPKTFSLTAPTLPGNATITSVTITGSAGPAGSDCMTSLTTNQPNPHFAQSTTSPLTFTYTPITNCRGNETAVANIADSLGNQYTVNITAVVNNPITDLQPALAVRAPGCILCHATVNNQANIITDFGLGNSYFFGQSSIIPNWKANIYADYGFMNGDPGPAGAPQTLQSLIFGGTMYVPTATMPSFVTSDAQYGNPISLTTYVQSQLKTATVKAAKTMYIGAPVAMDITSAFSLPANTSSGWYYYKNDSSSVDLSGLVNSDNKKFVSNGGTLNCDGDLVVFGPIYFNNLTVNTTNGCRMYVIGSVFMYGPLNFTQAGNATNNLQITSTTSINLGLGNTDDNSGNACNDTTIPLGRTNNYGATNSYGSSSLTERYKNYYDVPAFFTRSSQSDATVATNAILAEATKIQSDTLSGKAVVLVDASCGPGVATGTARQVNFSHLLLNAPFVQGRYNGSFTGSIIAEISYMGLGNFNYSFDSVFSKVPVLPFLDPSKYLSVSN